MRIIVFLRAPRSGQVKTRLAATLGDAAACEAYRLMVEFALRAVRATGLPVELRYTPDDAGAEIAGWAEPGWVVSPQGDGDLGERLIRAAVASVASGFQKTIIVGTDCPYLTTGDFHEALAALEDHEVVIGPARDGGYWLIGLRGEAPVLFQGIPWSSSGVLAATLQQARAANLRVRCLRELEDIDTIQEWERFQRFLEVRSGVDAG